jgi:serine/threonine protein kinase
MSRTFPSIVDDEQNILQYGAERIIGNGSFGVVLEARVVETNKMVAIQKVPDKQSNQELPIMHQLFKDPHTNILYQHCCIMTLSVYIHSRYVLGGLFLSYDALGRIFV